MNNKLSSSDIIGIAAVLLIVIGGACVSYFMIIDNINSCTRDPVKYLLDYKSDLSNYSIIEIHVFNNYSNVPIKIYKLDYKAISDKDISLFLNLSNKNITPNQN